MQNLAQVMENQSSNSKDKGHQIFLYMFFSLFEYSLIHKLIIFAVCLCPDLPKHSRVQVVLGTSREIGLPYKDQNTLENIRHEKRF